MHWCLLIENFGSELINIKGEHNVVAYMLSRIPYLTPKEEVQLFDYFNFDKEELPKDAFPLPMKILQLNKERIP
jgi:hypothetical protein